RAEASSAAPAGAAGPAPAEPAGAADGAEPDLSRVFGPAREGGLGRSAAQTWRQLKERGAEGATLQELSEAVGFQQATVSKHVTGLADHSLALRRDDRWYAASTAP
ncbi:hypothetical protein HCC30_27915, partial [Streptomyces sp. HNM0574]|nr:hypothetical protein [Streptomyces sp. HNM0574]